MAATQWPSWYNASTAFLRPSPSFTRQTFHLLLNYFLFPSSSDVRALSDFTHLDAVIVCFQEEIEEEKVSHCGDWTNVTVAFFLPPAANTNTCCLWWNSSPVMATCSGLSVLQTSWLLDDYTWKLPLFVIEVTVVEMTICPLSGWMQSLSLSSHIIIQRFPVWPALCCLPLHQTRLLHACERGPP